jgi:hypothetical protein
MQSVSASLRKPIGDVLGWYMAPSPFPTADLTTLRVQNPQADGSWRPIHVDYEIHDAGDAPRVGVEFFNNRP